MLLNVVYDQYIKVKVKMEVGTNSAKFVTFQDDVAESVAQYHVEI